MLSRIEIAIGIILCASMGSSGIVRAEMADAKRVQYWLVDDPEVQVSYAISIGEVMEADEADVQLTSCTTPVTLIKVKRSKITPLAKCPTAPPIGPSPWAYVFEGVIESVSKGEAYVAVPKPSSAWEKYTFPLPTTYFGKDSKVSAGTKVDLFQPWQSALKGRDEVSADLQDYARLVAMDAKIPEADQFRAMVRN